MSTDRYVSPLSERYASKEMQYIFSPDMKFRTWRRLWIALAETEKELGLNITQEQIDELKAHAEDINYDVAKERERQVRHAMIALHISHVTVRRLFGEGPALQRRQPRYHFGELAFLQLPLAGVAAGYSSRSHPLSSAVLNCLYYSIAFSTCQQFNGRFR